MRILRQKIFFLDQATGAEITGKELLERKKANGGSLASNLGAIRADRASAEASKVAQRASNKAAGAAIAGAAKTANAKGYANGLKAGQASATINKGTLMNTWNKMGTAGKVGTAAAAIGGAALLAKGAKSLIDKKKEEK